MGRPENGRGLCPKSNGQALNNCKQRPLRYVVGKSHPCCGVDNEFKEAKWRLGNWEEAEKGHWQPGLWQNR